MQRVIGVCLIAVGVASGLYVGVWWSFIGGIVDVIASVRADELIAMDVAIGVAKVVLAGLFGWIAAVVFIIPGFALSQK